MTKPKRYALYELRKGEEVLYVGITTDPQRRIRQHRNFYTWAIDCEMTFKWVGGVKRARSMERAAIRRLRPTHNTMMSSVSAPQEFMPIEQAARIWLTNPHMHTRDVLSMMTGWHYTMAWEYFGPRRIVDANLTARGREHQHLRESLLKEVGLL